MQEYEAELRALHRDKDALRKRINRIEDAARIIGDELDLLSAGDSWQAQRDEAKVRLLALDIALRAAKAERELIAEGRKATKDAAQFGKLRAILEAIDKNQRLAAFLKGETSSLEANAN
jgi:hypothetical protein